MFSMSFSWWCKGRVLMIKVAEWMNTFIPFGYSISWRSSRTSLTSTRIACARWRCVRTLATGGRSSLASVLLQSRPLRHPSLPAPPRPSPTGHAHRGGANWSVFFPLYLPYLLPSFRLFLARLITWRSRWWIGEASFKSFSRTKRRAC